MTEHFVGESGAEFADVHPVGAVEHREQPLAPLPEILRPDQFDPEDRAAEGAGRAENLAELINCKELLLRSMLMHHMNIPYYSILLAADNKARITDRYGKIPVSCLNTVLSDIRTYSDGRRYISDTEMQEIKEALQKSEKPVTEACPVDCGKIADEYAAFAGRCSAGKGRSLLRKVREMFGMDPAQGTDIGAV